MRISGWLLCGALVACSHHEAAKPAPPTDVSNVAKAEMKPTPQCRPPRTATTDAAEYDRFVATSWCRGMSDDSGSYTDKVMYGADGHELMRSWSTDASGKVLKDKHTELCWRLEGGDLHESHIDGTRDRKTGHMFEEDGKLSISVYDMSITYSPCPAATP